jgi:ribonuclease HII
MTIIAGIDEAGRGPLAGPVIAAAVVLDAANPIAGLRDSKKLSEKKRESLYQEIMAKALAVGIGRAEPEEIDAINILQATMLAMQRAFFDMSLMPTQVLVDGNRSPQLPCSCAAIVKGDDKIIEISAASIIAKVTRDREMVRMDKKYPGYGFAQHKGYPTRAHKALIKQQGLSEIHRKSFRVTHSIA